MSCRKRRAGVCRDRTFATRRLCNRCALRGAGGSSLALLRLPKLPRQGKRRFEAADSRNLLGTQATLRRASDCPGAVLAQQVLRRRSCGPFAAGDGTESDPTEIVPAANNGPPAPLGLQPKSAVGEPTPQWHQSNLGRRHLFLWKMASFSTRRCCWICIRVGS